VEQFRQSHLRRIIADVRNATGMVIRDERARRRARARRVSRPPRAGAF
jgi:hypothetical protein